MFKLLKLKWQKEFEELKSIHKISMADKEAELQRTKILLRQEHDLAIKEAIALTKLEAQKKLDEMRAKHQSEMSDFRDKLSKEYYDRTTNAMTKLHEEGNLTTKFVQELAVSMMNKAPETKVKVLTGKVEENVSG